MENDGRPGIDASRVVWGGALVLAGVVLLLERLDVLELARLWRLWPAVLIVAGLADLLGSRKVDERRSGLWLIMIGAWLLAHVLGLLRIRRSWPLLLAMAGVVVIWEVLRRRPRGASPHEAPHDR